jgi:5-methyltetrahydrofolate--homocysteine methyltransferase
MSGLSLIERLTKGDDERQELASEIGRLVAADNEKSTEEPKKRAASAIKTKPLRADVTAPPAPDLERHVIDLDLDEIWEYINPQMLYGKHLGLRGSVAKLRRDGDEKYLKLEAVLDEVKSEARSSFDARAVWQFFRAQAEAERLTLLASDNGSIAAEWQLERQSRGEGRCLTDYVLADDCVALFVTTAGSRVREQSLEWKEEGEYLKSHAVASLALETAEAAAEWLHHRLREQWGFPDPPETSAQDRFSGRYRGKRYSFGYPACPDLAGQRQLFEALQPADIGVELTEGDMMNPAASVSALVFHHPEAKYFGV